LIRRDSRRAVRIQPATNRASSVRDRYGHMWEQPPYFVDVF
jgi:hypothetical protein